MHRSVLTRVARGTDLVLVGLVCLVWVWVRDGLGVARGKDLVLVGLVCLVWVWVRGGFGCKTVQACMQCDFSL